MTTSTRPRSPNAPASTQDPATLVGRDIVCLSFVGWDDYWGTPQQLMSRLAKSNRLLFVAPPASLLSLFTDSRGPGFAWRRLNAWRDGAVQVGENVYAASLPPVLPFRFNPVASRINALLVREWLKREVEQLGFLDPVFWNFQPSLPGVGQALGSALSVYHCVDDFASVPHWWNQAADVRAREAQCCAEADLVICTSRRLAENRRDLNSSVHTVLNAADVELFAGQTDAPADIASLPRPVIGFSGVIDFRFDVDLVGSLAQRRPDWSIVIAGHQAPGAASGGRAKVPGGGDLSRLEALSNVHLLGWKPREQLPAYVQAMDVCLIPYVESEFVRNIFPLKFFEYMAAGKPIVATGLDELQPYAPDLVRLASTPQAFHDAVVVALKTDSSELARQRREAAAGQTWDDRAEQVARLVAARLESTLPARRA